MFDLNEVKRFFSFLCNNNTKIILFGTGQYAKVIYEDLNKIEIKIEYCIDNDKNKWGKYFNNLEIKAPEAVKNEDLKNVYVIVASMFYKQIVNQLKMLGVMNYIYGKEFLTENLVNSPVDVREWVSKVWLLEGKGIEIGALYNPLPIKENLEVQYVDYVDSKILRETYQDKAEMIIDVDVIDTAEKLINFHEDSLDFIIANHVIEHTVNPIGTLETFMKKLKKKGRLFLCVPNKRYTFDQRRQTTSFEHLLEDYKDDGENSKYFDYRDYAIGVNNVDEAEIEAVVERMIANKKNIHFHVWDSSSWFDFLLKTNNFLNNIFEIKHLQQNGNEVICVLEKV